MVECAWTASPFNEFLEQLGELLGVVGGSQFLDPGRRHAQLGERPGDGRPELLPLLPFGEVEVGDLLAEPLEKVVAEGRLGEIKGFGDALVDKITKLVTTGKLPYYDDLKASVAPGLVEMLGIPSLGPKKVKKLHDELGVDTIEALEAACQAGKVAVITGGARNIGRALALDLAAAGAEPAAQHRERRQRRAGRRARAEGEAAARRRLVGFVDRRPVAAQLGLAQGLLLPRRERALAIRQPGRASTKRGHASRRSWRRIRCQN